MPESRIFAEEFCYGEHDKRKPHAYGKPGKYGRKTCDKRNSPQVFKLANADNGGISFILFGNVCGSCGGVQVNWPKVPREN